MVDRTNLNWVDWLALALVIIGALNWGLTGLGGFLDTNLNIVNLLLGGVPTLEYLVYLIIGLAGLYTLFWLYRDDTHHGETTY